MVHQYKPELSDHQFHHSLVAAQPRKNVAEPELIVITSLRNYKAVVRISKWRVPRHLSAGAHKLQTAQKVYDLQAVTSAQWTSSTKIHHLDATTKVTTEQEMLLTTKAGAT